MTENMFRALAFGTALAGAGLAAAPAGAAASFFVVHGIPGRDVAKTADPLLPVDVLVNGKLCLLSNLTFGTIAGPYDVPAGTYTVAVSLANPIAPCSNDPVVTGSVTLADGEFGAAVAQLSPKGAPALGAYPIDVSAIGAGNQRFVAIHAADAPTVTVTIQSRKNKSEMLSFKLRTGKEKTASVKTQPGFDVEAAIGRGIVGPFKVEGADETLFLAIAVGSAESGSLTLLTKTVPDVF